MNKENTANNKTEYNSVLLSLNDFMLEQNELNDYEELIKAILNQLQLLFNPIATVYSEYDEDNKVLSIKEINVNQSVLNFFARIGGKRIFSTVTPVNDDMYEKMTGDRIEIVSTMHEATAGAVSKSVSSAIGKTLNINCYLGLAFMVDDRVYGTAVIVLKEEPEHSIIDLLKTYIHFTSISLKRVLAERALKEREQELKTITENMTDLVSMADVEGRYSYLSGNHYDLFGYEEVELLGRYVWEILYSEDLDKIADMFSKCITAGEGGQAEYRVVRKDGSLIWVDTVGSILYDNEAISGALFVTRNITDRKQAEQALKESEQELKTVAENMTDLVSMTDAEGRITYVSGSYYQLLGYEKDELLGKTVFEIVCEDDLPDVLAKFQEGVAKGENDSVDYKAVKKDGSIIWLETKSNLLFDSEGSVSGVIFSTRDITERKKVEEALRESEQKYRNIADNVTDVVWVADMNFKVTYVSPSVERMFGETVEEHLQKTLEQKFTPQSLECMFRTLQEEMEKEKDPLSDKNRTRVLEVEYYKADGNTIWVSMHISALRDDRGIIKGFQGVARDVTDRKKTEDYIRYISYHDQLTDLYNRHYFEQCKEDLKDLPVLNVIMTDVNGLKLVNDTYGHKAGDELLKTYANILRKSFRQSDLFFRWGGDEFIIILKNTEETKSWELCNRLIKHCGETFVNDIPLSISVGISSKAPGQGIDKAIQEAEDLMYKHKLLESRSSKNLIMKTLLETLSEKSFETKEHIDRMNLIGRQFGESLSLPPSELSRLGTLTMLHDIGKINIDKHVLLKKTALTDEEWEEIIKHTEVGYRITRTTEEFAYVAEEILSHHERWDGKGYPQGLEGKSIPYLARVLNLIDSYEVMCSSRPYKNKMSVEEIIEEIVRCSGKQFDPDLAEEFVLFLREGYDEREY